MRDILIIKTGAAGDVVRTTTLLGALDGAVTWIIDPKNAPLLPENIPSLQIIGKAEVGNGDFFNRSFDLVLSLEEDRECAEIASKVRKTKLTGMFLEGDELRYTDDAAGWFDMSLVSRRGREEANRLKIENEYSFQHWLFKMVGKPFSGEPYLIYRNPAIQKNSNLVGIETRSGGTWPNKKWWGYNELIKKLRDDGFDIKIFTQKNNIRDYLDEIAACSCIISADSLPMHVALAYKIPAIAIFNCTPPNEIYDYGYLTKVVSPILKENLYDRQLNPQVVNAIDVSVVYNAVKESCVFK